MIIQSTRVWTGKEFEKMQLELEHGKIKGIYSWGSKPCDYDYKDSRILPGLIDVHTHGAYGFDTNDGNEEGLRYWVSHIPQEGVTSILPTTVTQSKVVLKQALKSVASVIETGYEGAEILGVHFEGPYLDVYFKGAQPQEAIVPASIEEFQEYQRYANGWIKYITLASEHDRKIIEQKNMTDMSCGTSKVALKTHQLIRYCGQNGVVVSLGHSSAGYEETMKAIDEGATSVTHVFNGMAPFHHRNPGLLGAALTDDRLYGELICDGHHTHLAVINLFFRCKGADKGILITDSLSAKYGKAGEHYELGGHEIFIDEKGTARLSESGTIAGSTLKMNEGLRIAVEEAGVPEQYVINACTINPARMLGVDDRKGKLCVGYDADIVVLDDGYQVIQTYCRGIAV